MTETDICAEQPVGRCLCSSIPLLAFLFKLLQANVDPDDVEVYFNDTFPEEIDVLEELHSAEISLEGEKMILRQASYLIT